MKQQGVHHVVLPYRPTAKETGRQVETGPSQESKSPCQGTVRQGIDPAQSERWFWLQSVARSNSRSPASTIHRPALEEPAREFLRSRELLQGLSDEQLLGRTNQQPRSRKTFSNQWRLVGTGWRRQPLRALQPGRRGYCVGIAIEHLGRGVASAKSEGQGAGDRRRTQYQPER